MSELQATDGPWWLEQDGHQYIILAMMGPIKVSPGSANSEHDAHLMVNSRRLYENCQSAMDVMNDVAQVLGRFGSIDLADDLRLQARAINSALSAARGESESAS